MKNPLAYFLAKLPTGTPEAVAQAMTVRFHDAEQRAGRPLSEGYAYFMVVHYHSDVLRSAERAVRKAQRDVVAKAVAIQAEAEAKLREQAAVEFMTLCESTQVGRLAESQQEALVMLRMFAIEEASTAQVMAFFRGRLLDNAIQARVSRIRKRLRPVAVALGLTALVEYVFDRRFAVHVRPPNAQLGLKREPTGSPVSQ